MFKRLSSKKWWGIALVIGSVIQWYYAGYDLFWGGRSPVDAGEGRIIAAIFFVSGLVLYYMPSDPQAKHPDK